MKGAIFDLDGTLVDSMPVWAHIGEAYLLDQGITPPQHLRKLIETKSLRESAAFFRTLGVQASEEQIVAGVVARVADLYERSIPLKPGAEALVKRLHRAGVRMCVATASNRPQAEAVLRRPGLLPYFQGIITCGEVGGGKESPAIYERALALLNVPKQETLVFEDALHALRTAQAAGFRVVGVYDASAAADEALIRREADAYVRCLADFQLP